MFYSDTILTKRGPLARVWLAAHWERKLSKTQFLQTDIDQSVEAIMGQGTMPMALRLSGQLLLGIVRIYSRKAKYLLDDCNEALLRIKMAFRSGAADLTSDHLTAPRNAITLQPTRTEIDLLIPAQLLQAWNVDPFLHRAPMPSSDGASPADARARSRSRSATPARALGLRASHRAYAQGAFGGGLFAENESDFGLDSQDYDAGAFDLGMDEDIEAAERARVSNRRSVGGVGPRERGISTGLGAGGPRISELARGGGDDPMDDSLDVGVGRDAAPEAGMASLGSLLGGVDTGAGALDFDAPLDMGFDFGGADMPELNFEPEAGLDSFGAGGDGTLQGAARPSTPEPMESFEAALANVTPRTAAKIREAAERRLQAQAAGTSKSRRQIVDRFTQLADAQTSQYAARRWLKSQYLPRSQVDVELQAIHKDPASFYFPWHDASAKDSTDMFFGSATLAPELHELFTVDVATVLRKRAVSPGPGELGLDVDRSSKRLRRGDGEGDDDGDLESEVGRRADPLREVSAGPFEGVQDAGLDYGGMGDDGGAFDFTGGYDEPALGDFGLEGGLRRSLRKHNEDEGEGPTLGRLSALPRLSTPDLEDAPQDGDEGEDEEAGPLSHPLAAFAARPSDAQAALERQSLRSGLSRNTVRAVKVLKTQIAAAAAATAAGADESAGDDTQDDGEAKKPAVSFEAVSTNANRRAAAGFFFELLVLATKDCVKLKQEQVYGDVEVVPKERLFSLAV